MIEALLFHTPMIQQVIFWFTNHRDSFLMNVNVIMNSHIVEMFKTFFFYTSPVDTGRKLNVHKTFRDVLSVFWTSFVHSIYVLCLRGLECSKTQTLLEKHRSICSKTIFWFKGRTLEWKVLWLFLKSTVFFIVLFRL